MPERTLKALPVPDGARALELLPLIRAALDGENPHAFLPVPEQQEHHAAMLRTALRAGEPIEDGPAFVLATSGSTAAPKGALLSPAALAASAAATHARLNGPDQEQGEKPAQWLLALPAWHIAGLMVLVRAVLEGAEPAVIDVSGGFDPAALPAAVAALGAGRRYTSLVPNQLVKALGVPAAREALAALDAVLVGGGALAPQIRAEAHAAGVRVVTTYGMSETCGGCVYDQVPLDGVRVEIDAHQRIHLAGPMLASGYRGMPEHPAFARPGWFATSDAGQREAGRLRVLGRLDGGISTGGLTIAPKVVEEALLRHPGVRECAVVGVPDHRLGEAVAAVVVPEGSPPALDELREHVTRLLDALAAPRALRLVGELPRTGLGKTDRQALVRLFA
ncbi:AMP-dependent synthetase and ligase [Segniliparus rotundus DSM 44985]|uniref:AMP-dependent synthetase and ligase n=1 Tax=Segniliparus rotundus (strain ATCC BAA-972 / CDC 1076 / CIP 108378 / DSM 44985 / JCM 13578) TaxID=640132 RepID=D6ZCP0_SEGRD|nr:o-succinylbenzoate--CoA ligase [Segniliparus rotundus]ADG97082.1 AMP-dependent synthetase and ligase [Segniliparus rotundus DSM 44985]